MKAESPRCSIPTELLIPSSFLPYQSRRSSSGHLRCALITQIFTQNCKNIFDRTQSNILLSRRMGGVIIEVAARSEDTVSAPSSLVDNASSPPHSTLTPR